ncbi:hypothetical protein BpHYR1_052482 [Brachionus plicatilis]|uniref:Uncharacterized protein n=1 Tax=Brachionus plicatilis TaxID=10195 RepID=A0A3M7PZJ9_BRAPC|nr:hypothetical protein BpHYR1_052482 [Brachionus plicatilis]
MQCSIGSTVVEEIQWVSVPKKITFDNTLSSIKEQLSETGLIIRLAKNKSFLDGITLKIERFFISFNPSENLDHDMLNNAINAKPELIRSFFLFDMDHLVLANLRAKPKAAWINSYKTVAAKFIASNTQWENFLDLCDAEEIKEKEKEDIMKNIESFLSDDEETQPCTSTQINQEVFSPRKFKFKPS